MVLGTGMCVRLYTQKIGFDLLSKSVIFRT